MAGGTGGSSSIIEMLAAQMFSNRLKAPVAKNGGASPNAAQPPPGAFTGAWWFVYGSGGSFMP